METLIACVIQLFKVLLYLQLAKYFKVNEDELIVAWLSDKLANEVQDEDLAKQALKAAEKKVEYLKKKK